MILLIQNTAPLTDIVLILFTKSLTIVGFYYFMKYWIKKQGNSPKFLTWFLGLFFTFLQPYTIFEGLFRMLYDSQIGIFSSDLMRPENSGSLAVILGAVSYFYLNKRINN